MSDNGSVLIYARIRRPLMWAMAVLWATAVVVFVSQFVFWHELRWYAVFLIAAAAINLLDAFLKPKLPAHPEQ